MTCLLLAIEPDMLSLLIIYIATTRCKTSHHDNDIKRHEGNKKALKMHKNKLQHNVLIVQSVLHLTDKDTHQEMLHELFISVFFLH